MAVAIRDVVIALPETLLTRSLLEGFGGREPFEDKMNRLVADLQAQFAESARLKAQIRANLKGLGYGG